MRVILILLSLLTISVRAEVQPLQTVQNVDLTRYMGLWYEIARYPNRFQRKCVSDVTARYRLLDNGQVEVINSCRRSDGSVDTAKGRAKVVDKTSNAKLKVTFFWPFYGNYWIVDLGANYEYAVVGEPDRRYLWILSRAPKMDETLYKQILARVAANGYDTNRLVKTPQN